MPSFLLYLENIQLENISIKNHKKYGHKHIHIRVPKKTKVGKHNTHAKEQ